MKNTKNLDTRKTRKTAYKARWIARFNAQHEGMISRSGGRVMIYRAGVWTRK